MLVLTSEVCGQWLAQPDVLARLSREAAAAQQGGYSIVEAAEAAAVDLQCTAPMHPELTPLEYCRSLLSSTPQTGHKCDQQFCRVWPEACSLPGGRSPSCTCSPALCQESRTDACLLTVPDRAPGLQCRVLQV